MCSSCQKVNTHIKRTHTRRAQLHRHWHLTSLWNKLVKGNLLSFSWHGMQNNVRSSRYVGHRLARNNTRTVWPACLNKPTGVHKWGGEGLKAHQWSVLDGHTVIHNTQEVKCGNGTAALDSWDQWRVVSKSTDKRAGGAGVAADRYAGNPQTHTETTATDNAKIPRWHLLAQS